MLERRRRQRPRGDLLGKITLLLSDEFERASIPIRDELPHQ
jgi:hypothetical protein